MTNRRTARLAVLSAAVLCLPVVLHAQRARDGKPPQAAAVKAPTVSKAVIKQVQSAQAAIAAQKWPECLAALTAAEAVPGRAPYDDFAISELRIPCSARTGDFATTAVALAKGLEIGAPNGFLDAEAIKQRYKQLMQVNYQLKNYPKVVEYGKLAVAGDPGNTELRVMMAQALYLTPDYPGTVAAVEPLVSEIVQRGETPPDVALGLWTSACVRMKDDACTLRAVEKQVAYAPTDEAWGNLFLLTMQKAPPDQSLNVLRFANEVGALKTGDDVAEYASLALEKGYPGEAQSVMEAAVAAGKFGGVGKTTPGAANLLQMAKTAATPDRATLPKQAKDAAAAKTGTPEVRLGQAYLSYGQPAEAVGAIERGLARGGVKDMADANLSLGIARLRAGDKAGAAQAFDAVQGNPFAQRLAGYWKLRTR
jgi:tetratricopeptide (TPR) repeat protein